jgi:hypothetical protein
MNDLFISYAHIDDQPLTEGAKGWISRLHRLLEIRLSQLMGERPNIWRDPTLQGSEIFGETIVRQLSEVKAMVSIVSPRYVKSDWCIREVEEFCKAAQPKGGIRCGHKSRVVKVVKTPVPSAEYPVSLFEIFNSQLGFEFFDIDQESGRVREFSEELGEAAKQRFLEKVDDLAHDLRQLLKLLKDPLPPPSGKTVYLALSSFDVQRERDRIYRELVERGHTVLPEAPLPIVLEEFEKVVRADLERSQLAIHMVGSRYGMIPDGSSSSVVELQVRLSREKVSDPSFRRLIWLPNDLPTLDEHQASFLKRLREDADMRIGTELLQDNVEKLKEIMLEILQPPKKKETAVAPATGQTPWVYLICDQEDDARVDPLEEFLFDQGLEVGRPHFDGSESEISEGHRRNLQICDAALIFYGGANRTWVDMKLMDLAQAPGYGRTKPMLAKTVCIAPPDQRDKQRFRTHLAEIIRLPASFSGEALSPFLQHINQREAGAGTGA